MKPECKECKWWRCMGNPYGTCHATLPKADAEGRGVWPMVRAADFCREFEPKDDRASRLLGTAYMQGSYDPSQV